MAAPAPTGANQVGKVSMAMGELSTIRDHKQLLWRFGGCLVVVALALGVLLWNQQHWIEVQHRYVEAGSVVLDLRNSIYKISLMRGDLYAPEHDVGAQRAQSEILRLKELLASVDGFASLGDTDPRKAFYRYYHSREGRLEERVQEFLKASENSHDPSMLPFVPEITTALTTLAGQDFLESEVLTQRLSRVQLGIFASILALFIVLSIFIILPARRLLVAQRKAQDRAMQEMQEKNRKLAASREVVSAQKTFLESVLTHSRVPLVHFDRKGKLLHLSRVIRELFPGAWDAASWEIELSMKLRESKEVQNPALVRTWITSIFEGKSITNQLVILPGSHSNEAIHLLVNGHPVENAGGVVESGVLYFLDITERIHFEDNLRDAMRGAEAASRAKSEFLANISHEIRTPMTSILGYTDLLLEPSTSEREKARSIDIIRRNTKSLLVLINDILDITRIESGNQIVRRAVTPLLELLSEVVHLLRFRAEEKGLQLNVSFEGKVPKAIYTDGMRLRQILINLLGNATKFTDKGEVRLTVRFDPPRKLIFTVSDTGCGIAPDYVGKLFTPFAQEETGAARKHGGTGLGLALSRRLAQGLGGDLRLLTSTPGVGSAFITEIDVGNIEESSLVDGRVREYLEPIPSEVSGATGESLKGKRVLLVDDSAEIRDLVSFYLSKSDAEVVAVSDGPSALKEAATGTFDVILMDLRMPTLDGYETLSRIRERGSTVPVLALTAHAMAEEKERSLAAGFSGLLTKPIDPGLLRRECARVAGIVPSPEGISLHESSRKGLPRPVRDIMARFLENLPDTINEMSAQVSKQDMNGLRNSLHRLAGAAGSCGFEILARKAEDLEEEVVSNGGAPELIERIKHLGLIGEQTKASFERLPIHEELE